MASTGMASATKAPVPKHANDPHVSMMTPASVGPNARPQMLPEVTHVSASVIFASGTARSAVSFSVMTNGAYVPAAMKMTTSRLTDELTKIIDP